MKQTCPACGCMIDSHEEKCPRCGAPLPPAAGTDAPEPPAAPPLPPPFRGEDRPELPKPPRRKSHAWIYITISAVCATVAAIVLACVLRTRQTAREYDYGSLETLPLPVETETEEISAPYAAEDAPTDLLEADTLQTDTAAVAEETTNLLLTGTLVLLSDESTTCDVIIRANVASDGQVTGTATWNGGESDIAGRYIHAEERLILNETDGSRYDGHIRSGYSYNGTYEDRTGTWRFTMNMN